jgi:pimeloyl-ACP methyl ester carboxylesterase
MKLFYREYGSGIPIMILHGLYGSSDNWSGIARELSDRFRVILPDLRNHGRSPHDPVHTYDAISDDIAGLAGDLGLERFIIAGHSMGGRSAIWFARRWPARTAGLIVLDMSPFRRIKNEKGEPWFHSKVLRLMSGSDPAMFREREDAEKLFDEKIGDSRITAFLLKNLTRDKNGEFRWKLNPGILLDNLDNIMDGLDPDPAEIIPVTGFPVLFLRAEHSGYITEHDIELIPSLFPAAEIITVKDTSHWLHAEKPAEITELIREFAT